MEIHLNPRLTQAHAAGRGDEDASVGGPQSVRTFGAVHGGPAVAAGLLIYWWVAFAKGYITEVAIFQDLARSGIVFQAHDLSQFSERFSPDDLTISGMRGDIKSSSYFLHSARHFPLKHDFYIAALYDPQMRQQRRVVIMQPDACLICFSPNASPDSARRERD